MENKKTGKSNVIVLILVALIIVGVAVYAITGKDKKESAGASNATSSVPDTSSAAETDSTDSTVQETTSENDVTEPEITVNVSKEILAYMDKSLEDNTYRYVPYMSDEDYDYFVIDTSDIPGLLLSQPIYCYYKPTDHSKSDHIDAVSCDILPDLQTMSFAELKAIFKDKIGEPVETEYGYREVTAEYDGYKFEFTGYVDENSNCTYMGCTVYNRKG